MKNILVGPTMYRAKCSYCDCEFEYDMSEVYNQLVNLEGFRHGYGEFCVDCPNCGNMIFHEGNPKSSTEMKRESTMKI